MITKNLIFISFLMCMTCANEWVTHGELNCKKKRLGYFQAVLGEI